MASLRVVSVRFIECPVCIVSLAGLFVKVKEFESKGYGFDPAREGLLHFSCTHHRLFKRVIAIASRQRSSAGTTALLLALILLLLRCRFFSSFFQDVSCSHILFVLCVCVFLCFFVLCPLWVFDLSPAIRSR